MPWALMIPMMALMIPIVAIFTAHQQKMAQILNRNNVDHDAMNSLRQEIAELKSLVHSQAITLDTLAGNQRSLNTPPPTPSISDRLTTGS